MIINNNNNKNKILQLIIPSGKEGIAPHALIKIYLNPAYRWGDCSKLQVYVKQINNKYLIGSFPLSGVPKNYTLIINYNELLPHAPDSDLIIHLTYKDKNTYLSFKNICAILNHVIIDGLLWEIYKFYKQDDLLPLAFTVIKFQKFAT